MVVVAHPHADDVEAAQIGTERADGVEGGADAGKVLAHARLVVSIRSHPHHAADMRCAERLVAASAEEVHQLVGRETEFCLLGSDMELHEHTGCEALPLSFGVDGAQQALGVDTLDHGGTQAQKLAHFVGLQMADKVPADFNGENRHFLCELLHTALAEAGLAGGISLGNHFSRMELRYSHQRDTLGKFLLNLPDIFGNAHCHTLII